MHQSAQQRRQRKWLAVWHISTNTWPAGWPQRAHKRLNTPLTPSKPRQEPTPKIEYSNVNHLTSPDELRPLAPEAEASGADKVGIFGRRGGAGGEGRRVDETPPEKELHQRHPLRPRVRYMYGSRPASGDSMTPWPLCYLTSLPRQRLLWRSAGDGLIEVIKLGAEEGEHRVRLRRRAVVGQPPERWRRGRGGDASVHHLQPMECGTVQR
jgi:hypothetical protein